MVKKISFLVLSVAILVIGVKSFSKLSYWDRSIRIFNISSDAPFEGRMGRGGEGRGEFGRPEMREIPDSIRIRFEARGDRQDRGFRERNIPDSLRRQVGPGNGGRMERRNFERGMSSNEGRGRGEFRESKKINIMNVKWFLAAFASFVVLAIYTDKIICLVRRRK